VGTIPRSIRTATALAFVFAALAVFFTAVALNVPYDSDHASMMVMGKAVLEGNPLLEGWTLGNQAYYTTELPFYALGIWLMGFTWKVIYILTGLHWAMITLALIVLAATDEARTASPHRAFVAFCLTFFLPALLLTSSHLSDAHLVGFFYCLIALFGMRSIEHGGRLPHYAVYGAFLTLAMIGDAFGLFLLAIPVVLVCVLRISWDGPRRQTIALLAVTLLAAALARAILELVSAVGGARIPGPPAQFVSLPHLEGNAYVVLYSILDLFAVRFFGEPVVSVAAVQGVIHISALLLLGRAAYVALARFREQDLYTQVLVTIIVVNVMEYFLSGAVALGTTYYLAPSLIFGIPLVVKYVFGSSIWRERRKLVLLYFLVLLVSLMPPLTFSKPPSQSDGLAQLLIQAHLKNGYGPFWRSNSTTVATAGQVTVRPVYLKNGSFIAPYLQFASKEWYSSRADFLVVQTDDSSGLQPTVEQATEIFGPPSEKHSLGRFGYLLVWDHDITPFLAPP